MMRQGMVMRKEYFISNTFAMNEDLKYVTQIGMGGGTCIKVLLAFRGKISLSFVR